MWIIKQRDVWGEIWAMEREFGVSCFGEGVEIWKVKRVSCSVGVREGLEEEAKFGIVFVMKRDQEKVRRRFPEESRLVFIFVMSN